MEIFYIEDKSLRVKKNNVPCFSHNFRIKKNIHLRLAKHNIESCKVATALSRHFHGGEKFTEMKKIIWRIHH